MQRLPFLYVVYVMYCKEQYGKTLFKNILIVKQHPHKRYYGYKSKTQVRGIICINTCT